MVLSSMPPSASRRRRPATRRDFRVVSGSARRGGDSPFTMARSMIGPRSGRSAACRTPRPSHRPFGWPRNASVTAGCPWRTGSEPCKRQADVLGDLAGAVLQRPGVGQTGAPVDMGVEPGVLSNGGGQFVEEHLDALRASCHGAQRIQSTDVAGPPRCPSAAPRGTGRGMPESSA